MDRPCTKRATWSKRERAMWVPEGKERKKKTVRRGKRKEERKKRFLYPLLEG